MKLRKFLPARSELEEFLPMCEDFYSGGATLYPIPRSQMEATFWKAANGSPYAIGYFIETEGKVAGYGLVYPFYSNEAGRLCVMLEEIYVKPEYRCQHLGTAYLEQIAEQVGTDIGEPVGGLKLEICPTNERARKLYESMGFQVLGYGSMVKKLPSEESSCSCFPSKN